MGGGFGGKLEGIVEALYGTLLLKVPVRDDAAIGCDIGGAVGGALDAVVGDALDVTVGDALDVAVGGALGATVGGAIDAAVGGTPDAAVGVGAAGARTVVYDGDALGASTFGLLKFPTCGGGDGFVGSFLIVGGAIGATLRGTAAGIDCGPAGSVLMLGGGGFGGDPDDPPPPPPAAPASALAAFLARASCARSQSDGAFFFTGPVSIYTWSHQHCLGNHHGSIE